MQFKVEYKSFGDRSQYIDKFMIIEAYSFWHAERVALTKLRLTEKQRTEIVMIDKYFPTKET